MRKDTVMTFPEYLEAMKKVGVSAATSQEEFDDIAVPQLEAQAEISFKAGRMAGTREVVEWINKRFSYITYGRLDYLSEL